MRDNVISILLALGFIALLFASYLAGFLDGQNKGNKEGQIMVLSGKAEYLLMEKEDKTRYWKKVEEYPTQCNNQLDEEFSFYYFGNTEGNVRQ